MRGKPRCFTMIKPPSGLIPAHAGKTTGALTLETVYRAHPRACGENLVKAFFTLPNMGSSPRMRGKPSFEFQARRRRGLIPAHAGKTGGTASIAPKKWAHPRACGENAHCPWSVVAVVGSSPRMRGKLEGRAKRERGSGLIPAHAGKTNDVQITSHI